jgi:Fe2+ transport system protein FeoA
MTEKPDQPPRTADGADAPPQRPTPAMPLSMFKPGQLLRLSEIRGGRRLQHRLAEMGLTPGSRFEVVVQKSRGPVIVNVKGARLMLGHGMIHRIYCTPIHDSE